MIEVGLNVLAINQQPIPIQCTGKIKGIATFKDVLALWVGTNLELYLFENGTPKLTNSIPCSNPLYCISESNGFIATDDSISIVNIKSNEQTAITLSKTDEGVIALTYAINRLYIVLEFNPANSPKVSANF